MRAKKTTPELNDAKLLAKFSEDDMVVKELECHRACLIYFYGRYQSCNNDK